MVCSFTCRLLKYGEQEYELLCVSVSSVVFCVIYSASFRALTISFHLHDSFVRFIRGAVYTSTISDFPFKVWSTTRLLGHCSVYAQLISIKFS